MGRFLLLLLPCLFIVLQAQAQGIRVTGKVTSAKDGTELPGVSVRIKNTTRGTITDINGSYEILTESPGDSIQFSFIGFVPQTVYAGQRSVVNVALEVETTELDEVVITGFQDVEKKLFTGSAVNVKMSDIRTSGMTDASQMLEGRVAGVTVDNVSGTFGTSPKIRIRGNTSINGDTQPLMVVDGVILEDLNALTADDIITGNANT